MDKNELKSELKTYIDTSTMSVEWLHKKGLCSFTQVRCDRSQLINHILSFSTNTPLSNTFVKLFCSTDEVIFSLYPRTCSYIVPCPSSTKYILQGYTCTYSNHKLSSISKPCFHVFKFSTQSTDIILILSRLIKPRFHLFKSYFVTRKDIELKTHEGWKINDSYYLLQSQNEVWIHKFLYSGPRYLQINTEKLRQRSGWLS